MHIVIAPNAFKGSLTAEQAAAAIAEGLKESKLNCRLTLFPVADGGDDTASLLIKNLKGENIPVAVHDPLGKSIQANLGWIAGDRTAIIALSDASGLRLLKKEERDPLRANTFGTGELILAALNKGAKKILIGVGGSATVDGGSGCLRALGVRFLNKEGLDLDPLPAALTKLEQVAITGIDQRMSQTEIIVLCDVKNKLLGSDGAARIFGPQKGADEKSVVLLEACLNRWNEITKQKKGIDMASLKYGGAAGGIAAALAAYVNAKLVNGIAYFLDETHFEKTLEEADMVITGEGQIDGQTLEGKGPFGVALRAKKKNIPVIALAGAVPLHPSDELQQIFKKIMAINPPGVSLDLAIKHTRIHLQSAATHLGNDLAEHPLLSFKIALFNPS